MLATQGKPHWAANVLTERGPVLALDRLASTDPSLARIRLLVMAQPRPLAPAESVALDRWLRKGGRLLLFADPLHTGESRFAFGDKRRPQDIAMLAPLLAHWGLTLDFAADQPPGERQAQVLAVPLPVPLPVNMPGVLVAARGRGKCRPDDAGLSALCRIGKGRAIIIADAAVFDHSDGESAAQMAALRALLAHLAAMR